MLFNLPKMNKFRHIFNIIAFSFTLSFAWSQDLFIDVKRTDETIIIDGKASESAWGEFMTTTSPFWQWRPTDSIRGKKQTSFKVLIDDRNLYILVKAETNGDNFTVPTLKRDFETFGADYLTFLFDTFNDATNAFSFAVNPYGAKADGLISSGNANYRTDRNYSWDTKWEAETTVNEGYYLAELKIPLSSLSYKTNATSWRFNLYRRNNQQNEHTTWAKIPQNLTIGNLAFMGELRFPEPLKESKTPLSIIPYINGITSKDFEENTSLNNALFGGDIKIPIGNALNVDLTFNPDFSQVEVDDQIVNLTRFEISLPEKRQFFTQNSDLFSDFGEQRDAIPFFSRKIGVAKDLDGNTIENKIITGVRLSGKISNNLRIGFLNMLTDEDIKNEIPSNLNTVFTLRQKVFNRSNISFLMIDRSTVKDYDFIDTTEKSNRLVGLEYNLASSDGIWTGRAFLHKSFTPEAGKDDTSSGISLRRNTRNHSFGLGGVYGGEDFKSDLGFYRRSGFLKISPSYSYRLYPKNEKVINYEFRQNVFMVYKPSNDFLLTDRWFLSNFSVRYLNQTSLSLRVANRREFLLNGFDPTRSGAEPLPEGVAYNFTDFEVSYRSDSRKLFSFDTEVSYGGFYTGTKFSVENEINWRSQPILSASLKVNYNKIMLPKPYASADLWLVSPKVEVSFNKKTFWTTYVQFSSQSENLGINSRLQWRFAPLSDLYLVYNDNYLTSDAFSPRYRSFNIKFTYWLNI